MKRKKYKEVLNIINKSSNSCFTALFLLLAFYFFHPIPLQGPNVDLGHHLLLGEIIVSEKVVPDTNLFAYTAQNFHYINTSWLSEVIFYKWHSMFGFNGLIFLSVFLITMTYLLLVSNTEVKKKLFSISIVSLLYFQILIDRTEVKPELFSLLFLSSFLFILYKYRKVFTKWIFILPFLELFWVNMHIYFVVGEFVVLLFLLDAVLVKKEKVLSKKVLILAGVTVATLSVTLINPHYFDGAVYPFTVFNNYGYKVIENFNFFAAYPAYHDLTFLYFIFAVLVLCVSVLLSIKKIKIIDILLICFFTFLAFYAVRNFPLFVIGTFVPAVTGLNYIFALLAKSYRPQTIHIIKVGLTIVVCLAILPGVVWTTSIHSFGPGVIDDADGAVKFLTKNNLRGPIYNNYNIGNYLEYRLYPEEKVFVNGSPEAYPKEFFENVYYPIEASYENFIKESNRYKFNVVFYDHVNQATNRNPLLSNLIKSNDWKLVYLNNRIVLFVKNIPENQKFISSHVLNEKNIQLREQDIDTKEKLQTLSNLFRVLEWYEKMYEMDLEYLSYDPNNCIALRHVSVYMSKTNHPLMNLYLDKFQQACN